MVEEQTKLEFAPIIRRVAAYLLDMLIFFILAVMVSFIFVKLCGVIWPQVVSDTSLAAFVMGRIPMNIAFGIILATQIVMVSVTGWFIGRCRWQATPGKRLLSIHIVTPQGRKLSYKNAWLRAFLPVCIMMVLNSATLYVRNQQLSQFNDVYTTTISSYLPEIGEELKARNMGILEYVSVPEGEKKYQEAFRALSKEHQQRIMDSVSDFDKQTTGIVKRNIKIVQATLFLIMAAWYLLAFFTKERTAGHDIIARTRVVKGKL